MAACCVEGAMGSAFVPSYISTSQDSSLARSNKKLKRRVSDVLWNPAMFHGGYGAGKLGAEQHLALASDMMGFRRGHLSIKLCLDASADSLFQRASILARNLGRSPDHSPGSGRGLSWCRDEDLARHVDILPGAAILLHSSVRSEQRDLAAAEK
ncbi:hypothetical protein J7T55_013279 [Diaporthe amygdali]|uniref:uncharacterized protein n=1 Tax=Phomopsis amygdali TaxID=1214568 RepID=UPI0022FEC4B8|nr:uncharacterized protein J7T55_013279 [Diaporthe amygdali]KAJ0119044.1 hypothetical protein J7T55_013279 [Diaporthe amygdali]